MKLKWTRLALRDMVCLYDYIAEDSQHAARKTVSIIYDAATQMLKKFPDAGRPGRCRGTRELILSRVPFIIVYVIKGDELHIVSVIHTSMKWPDKIPTPSTPQKR